MSWRILQITKPCTLKIKNKQLLYVPQEEEEISFPLEDISVLILENRQITMHNILLAELAKHGICLFSCDESHMPCGAYFPFLSYYQSSHMAKLQIEMRKPLQNRLWQELVRVKIQNQALCLKILQRQGVEKLFAYSKKVVSGDKGNIEAAAANHYFKMLFSSFSRKNDEDLRNIFLNYGYAILRACIARSLVGVGLLPCFGLHHANMFNAYNLADDIIEPYRPFVDFSVYTLFQENSIENINTQYKNQLARVLTKQIMIEESEVTVLKAIEYTCQSLAKSIKLKKNVLALPYFLE
ncbi:MAG TPA: type II CRISPR-associated endonuclease Cas1 [Desulfovibrio sp.]|nr:type II CRISPR-associated endonuclease Cas1 [Desulfovibrio sp.]